MPVYREGASLASLRSAPVGIVEVNVHIDVRVHVCVKGGALLASLRSARSVPVCIVDLMFTLMLVFMSV